jgi:hypothetical protein
LAWSLAALMLCGVASCGSDDRPPEPDHPLTQVVHDLQDRFEADDDAGVCALMSASAHEQAGEIGHHDPTSCVRDVRRVFDMIENGGGWLDQERPRVMAVADGDVALVTLETDGWRGEIPFVKESGDRRLAGFFGMDKDQFERTEEAFERKPFPATGRGVSVSDAGRNLCPSMSDARYPRITGGCEVEVSQKAVPVEVLTPFGGFKLDDCDIDYRLHIDPLGRTWTDRWRARGGLESSCQEVTSCQRQSSTEQGEALPWPGQIGDDGRGGYTQRVDMCLRTGVGNFVGELMLKFTRDASGGWRLKPTGANSTGVRFNRSMTVEGEPLRISPEGLST